MTVPNPSTSLRRPGPRCPGARSAWPRTRLDRGWSQGSKPDAGALPRAQDPGLPVRVGSGNRSVIPGAFDPFQRAIGEQPALRAPVGNDDDKVQGERMGPVHDPANLRRPLATACRRNGRGGRSGGPGDDKHRRPVIDRGRAVCGSWYHPGSSRPCGARPRLHGDGGGESRAGAMHRRDNGRRLLRSGAPVAAYFTAGEASPPGGEVAPPPVSGRGSRGFFAGVPDPASQQPRFSASFAPGTRPCHRQWTSSLALHPACGIAGCQGAWPEMRAVTSGW